MGDFSNPTHKAYDDSGDQSQSFKSPKNAQQRLQQLGQTQTSRSVPIPVKIYITKHLSSYELLVATCMQYYKISYEEAIAKINQGFKWADNVGRETTPDEVKRGFAIIVVNDTSIQPLTDESLQEQNEIVKELGAPEQKALNDATDALYTHKTNDKDPIQSQNTQSAQYWLTLRGDLLKRLALAKRNIPSELSNILDPNNPDLLEYHEKTKGIVELLSKFSDEELEDYFSKTTASTEDFGKFERTLENYLKNRKIQEIEQLEYVQTNSKLYGLEEIYKKYQLYKSVLMASAMSRGGGITASLKIRDELDSMLKARGFKSITEFETLCKTYLSQFQREAKRVAEDSLKRYGHFLFQQERLYADKSVISNLHQHIAQTGAKGKFAQADEKRQSARMLRMDEKPVPSNQELAMKLDEEAASLKSDASSSVSSIQGHPMLASRDLNREDIAEAENPAELGELLSAYLKEHKEAITETFENLNEDEDFIFQLPELIKATQEGLGIQKGSIQDLIIQDKVSDIKIKTIAKTIILTVVAIGLAIASAGTGTPAILAGIGSLALSTYDVYDSYQQYRKEKAAYEVGLSSDDPSMFWVVLSVVGVVTDAVAIRNVLKTIDPAIETFKKTEGVIEDGIRVSKLDKELGALEKLGKLDARIRKNLIKQAKNQVAQEKFLKSLNTQSNVYGFIEPITGATLHLGYQGLVRMYYAIERGLLKLDEFILEFKVDKILTASGVPKGKHLEVSQYLFNNLIEIRKAMVELEGLGVKSISNNIIENIKYKLLQQQITVDDIKKINQVIKDIQPSHPYFDTFVRQIGDSQQAHVKKYLENIELTAGTGYAEKLQNYYKNVSATAKNKEILQTGKDLPENLGRQSQNITTYPKTATVYGKRGDIASNSVELLAKQGASSLQAYDQQILELLALKRTTPKAFEGRGSYSTLDDVLSKLGIKLDDADLATKVAQLGFQDKMNLMKAIGVEFHHINPMGLFTDSHAIRRYVEALADNPEKMLDWHGAGKLENSIPLFSKRNLTDGKKAFEFGVHTNHEQVNAGLAAFYDARYAQVIDDVKAERLQLSLSQTGKDFDKAVAEAFHEDLLELTQIMKQELQQKSVLGNQNVNDLFGNLGDLSKKRVVATKVQQFFEKKGILLKVKLTIFQQ